MKRKIFGLFLSACVLTVAPTFASEAEEKKISLSDAVHIALQNNLNLVLQREEQVIAEGVNTSAEGKFDTIFGADAGMKSQSLTPLMAGASDQEDSTNWNATVQKRFALGTDMDLRWANSRHDENSGALLIDPVFNSTLSLGLNQPLLRNFGSDSQTADLEASKRQFEASTFLVDSQAADLAAQVKSIYWELVFAWQDIEVKKVSLALAERLLAETKDKIEAGSLADVELYRPESEVAKREEELISGERAIGTAEDQIKLLINSEDWLTRFIPTDLPDTTSVQPDLQTTIDNSLKNRPDIKAADLYIEAALIQQKRAKNSTLPSLDLNGRVGLGGTDDTYGNSIDNTFDDTETLWQVGLTFSAPLDNSLAKGQYIQAKASYNKAKTNALLLRQQIRRKVRTTVRDVELAIKAMEATKKTAYATMKGLEAEEIKFQAGRATTLDVLVAQASYSNALSAENRTKIIYVQSLAELDRIQGIITLNNQPVTY